MKRHTKMRGPKWYLGIVCNRFDGPHMIIYECPWHCGPSESDILKKNILQFGAVWPNGPAMYVGVCYVAGPVQTPNVFQAVRILNVGARLRGFKCTQITFFDGSRTKVLNAKLQLVRGKAFNYAYTL